MGKIRRPPALKLITGFIFKEESVFDKALIILQKKFGGIDFESKTLPFNLTDYYKSEFGSNLKRKFVSFKKLIPPQNLSRIKRFTNKLEEKLSINSRRLINIDPGYLDLAKLVLASTKDFAHRIYLDKGIFAEITLFYKNKTFRHHKWTFPDYRTRDYISVFSRIRQIFAEQIKNE